MGRSQIRWNIGLLALLFLFCAGLFNPSYAQEGQKQAFAGELFGNPVPLGNYYFVKSAIMVFGNRWGANPKTPEEIEDCVWNDLLLSFQAFQMNVVVGDDEVEQEITKMLDNEKAGFSWKKDNTAYANWVKTKTGETTELFENQIKHLIQLQKLRKQVMDGLSPEVSEQEAHQEFLNEQNNLSLELIEFEKLKDAEEFYKKAKSDPKFWENEKSMRPKDFKLPGFVTLEFLIDIWKIPKDAAFDMMTKKIGDIYAARPIYKGFGVFKILEQKPAKEADYPAQKNSYYEQIRSRKKYAEFDEWLRDLKQKANIKIYKINQ
ncbi:MAG: hypothetical protein WCL25_01665 [bacterium]